MTGSTYLPARWTDVEASKIRPNVIGIQATITGNSVQTVDTLVLDDMLIRGVEFLSTNANFGDSLTIKIVDIDGVYAPANTIVSVPVSNYVVPINNYSSYDSVAPMKMLGGLYLRIVYTSTGSTNVSLGINFLFVKLLL